MHSILIPSVTTHNACSMSSCVVEFFSDSLTLLVSGRHRQRAACVMIDSTGTSTWLRTSAVCGGYCLVNSNNRH